MYGSFQILIGTYYQYTSIENLTIVPPRERVVSKMKCIGIWKIKTLKVNKLINQQNKQTNG